MTETGPLIPGDSRNSAIAATIAQKLGDRAYAFVFPSQIAADSWATMALGLPGVVAIEKDRFLGWDRFIERATRENAPAGKKAAISADRLLWALSILREQSRRHFLRVLAKPGLEPPLSLAPNLARLAPTLSGIAREIDRIAFLDRGDEAADYLTLTAEYDRFLDEHGLYEPSHTEPKLAGPRRFIIFGPSLTPDFPRLEKWLSAAPEVELVAVPDGAITPRQKEGGARAPTLRKYATFREEIQDVLGQCASLVDDGLEPSAIAISVPLLAPDIQAHLGAMARQFGLPLAFHAGEPLSGSPFGRLLRALSGAHAEGFSLRTLRALLGKGALGLKNPAGAACLIRYATRYSVPEFSADRQAMASLWKRTFALCPSPLGAEARIFYDELVALSAAITGASTFDTLRRALHDFMDDFLVAPKRGTPADRTIERVFDELDALDGEYRRLGGPALAATPFETLLMALDSTRYSLPESGNAISVYPYHLGMLVASAAHFVIEASQDSLAPTLARYAPAPQEILPHLPPREELSDAIFQAFNAVHAVYYHAESSLSGFTVPHPYFLRDGVTPGKIASGTLPLPADVEETSAWSHSAPGILPKSLPRANLEAALGIMGSSARQDEPNRGERFPPPTFSTTAQPRGEESHREGPLDSSLLLAFPSCDASPLVKLTPSKLKDLQDCPFKWFASCVPDLDSDAGTANTAEGSLEHSLIRLLLRRVQETDGGFIAGRVDTYRGWIDETFDRALAQTLRQQGPAFEPSLSAARLKIQDRIERLLAFEEAFVSEGWGIGDFEVPLSMPLAPIGIALEGRADRIASGESPGEASRRLAIIDYKKGVTPKKGDFLVNADGGLRDFQLTGYAAMAESAGDTVERALYWSIEEGRAVYVFGSGKQRPDRESFERERRALDATLESAAAIIKAGTFLAVTPSKDACQGCTAKALCRALYSSERL